MYIRRAYRHETNDLLKMTMLVVKESTMGYQENNEKKTYDMFAPLLQSGAYYLISAENNTLTGWVLIGKDYTAINDIPAGGIFSLFVFPEYRKLGVGKQLMQAAIAELKEQNYQKVLLNVFAGNPAKRLYQELGFRDVSSIMELNLD
ncbi:GNAT family N-acetyltransferase [Metabacillus sp. GX 13764]|uniref:GNAT family N-acetyltransferase n=1 Tax=Metabacillus kandeliae TaxID=2900151 RepID=UPI001E379919|nr:GNAT family N-acetyltransferase [Metabacillus kandeliae]MCD7034371.1 GNAT family N-acetyltransferase [Metabacillus kandeliae]